MKKKKSLKNNKFVRKCFGEIINYLSEEEIERIIDGTLDCKIYRKRIKQKGLTKMYNS